MSRAGPRPEVAALAGNAPHGAPLVAQPRRLWHARVVRIFVTGARGFVGRRLTAQLAAAGHEVLAADRELDVRDADRVGRAVAHAHPDAIVHLAAHSSVARSFETPREVYRVNFLGARAVLEATAAHARGARVLLVGSGQVYGSAAPGTPPFRESDALRPASPYARTKAAADLLGGCWARRGLAVVRARPFNHTGPGQSDTFVAANLARQLAEIEAGARPSRLEVGNLESIRDFLDVDDVIEAYCRLLDPAVPAGAYNVARGVGTSIRELLDALLVHVRVKPEVVVDPARLRPRDVSTGSSERLTAATAWRPRVPLDETLGRMINDWRRRVAAP